MEKHIIKKKSNKTAAILGVGTALASVFVPAFQGLAYGAETESDSNSQQASQKNTVTQPTSVMQEVPLASETNSVATESSPNTEPSHVPSETTASSQVSTSPTLEDSENPETLHSSSSSENAAPEVNSHSTQPSSSKATQQSTDSSKEKKKETKETTDTDIRFTKNQSTTEFIKAIGEDARELAGKNDLYASVAIAQAILESASGNSYLSREPNYNLFGIKGSYQGASVEMPTMEDDGSGKLYSIQSSFRKYPSYKESLADYAELLKKGVNNTASFYEGTWKSKTDSYKEATQFLTGRYATDTLYNKKLDALIETYELEVYDHPAEKEEKTALSTSSKQSIKHIVGSDETLWDVARKYRVSVAALMQQNKLKDSVLTKGQLLIIIKKENGNQHTNTQLAGQEKSKENNKQEAVTQAAQKVSAIGESIAAGLNSRNVKVKGKQLQTGHLYTVKRGDSFASIAKEQNIPVKKLMEWNKVQNILLTEGQQLRITSPYV